MKLNVYVGENKDYKIEYTLHDNPTVHLIYTRLQQVNRVVSNTQTNGFRSETDIETDLENIVSKLNRFGFPIEYTPEELNHLHINFPTYLHQYYHDEQIRHTLSLFNNLIHELESTQRKNSRNWALHGLDIGEPLLEESYSLFEIPNGDKLYMNYPHVGKHFLELFIDKDVDCPDEQILLTQNYNASITQFFVNVEYTFNDLEDHLKTFYEKIKHKLPYEWGDDKLAIGYLPIGDMLNDRDEVLDEISKHKYIHSWECC